MGPLIPQLLVNGIIAGSFYALCGVSFGIIYRTTRIFHYSHSLVFTLAAYSFVFFTQWAVHKQIPYIMGVLAAIVSAVISGCAIEILLYRALRRLKATLTTTFLASLGFATAGVAVVLLFLSSNPRAAQGGQVKMLSFGPTNFTNVDVMMVMVSWMAIGLLLLFLSRSRYGTAIRAVGSNMEMAENIGIDINRIYLYVFAIGSGLFGIASFLFTAKNVASPYVGLGVLLICFVSVFLGGIRSIFGAALAGLILGIAENIGMVFLVGEYKIMIAYMLLFVVIIFKPEGLMGRKRRD